MTDWPGPDEGERPAAYIIILGDTKISKNFYCDHGIAAQSILLGAVEKGLGGCIFASIDREALRKTLNIDKHLKILLVIALGVPKEKVAQQRRHTPRPQTKTRRHNPGKWIVKPSSRHSERV